jgi:hypothetical protein
MKFAKLLFLPYMHRSRETCHLPSVKLNAKTKSPAGLTLVRPNRARFSYDDLSYYLINKCRANPYFGFPYLNLDQAPYAQCKLESRARSITLTEISFLVP